MHVDIREGSERDVERCVDLWTRILVDRDGPSSRPEIKRHARSAFRRPIVRFALVGSEPKGFALTLIRDEHTALLSRLCVRSDATSHGLGTALVLDAVEHARAGGFSDIELDVRVSNTRARALYTRAGFGASSDPWDFDGGDPMLTMSFDLTRQH